MSLTVSPLYAGVIALLFLYLSLRVVALRKSARIGLGTGENAELALRMRVHANCAEYAPLGLLLLAMAELQGAPGWVLHTLGLALVAGRLMHAWSFSQNTGASTGRVFGMILTFSMIACAAIANIGHALF